MKESNFCSSSFIARRKNTKKRFPHVNYKNAIASQLIKNEYEEKFDYFSISLKKASVKRKDNYVRLMPFQQEYKEKNCLLNVIQENEILSIAP